MLNYHGWAGQNQGANYFFGFDSAGGRPSGQRFVYEGDKDYPTPVKGSGPWTPAMRAALGKTGLSPRNELVGEVDGAEITMGPVDEGVTWPPPQSQAQISGSAKTDALGLRGLPDLSPRRDDQV